MLFDMTQNLAFEVTVARTIEKKGRGNEEEKELRKMQSLKTSNHRHIG